MLQSDDSEALVLTTGPSRSANPARAVNCGSCVASPLNPTDPGQRSAAGPPVLKLACSDRPSCHHSCPLYKTPARTGR